MTDINSAPATVSARPANKYDLIGSIPFALVHLSCIWVFFVEFEWWLPLLCVGSYYVRMFGITGGYHRYFSHRGYRTSRFVQFLLAFLGGAAAQKGPLWWSSHHRHHHKFSDQDDDVHSPTLRGLFWAHIGWILSNDHRETREELVRDFSKYPELRFLNRQHWVPPFFWAVGCYLVAGWPGVAWGFVLSTVLLWHGTFLINSLAHVFGRRRYPTPDTSRNSFLLTLLTLGEGWHNNHHYYPNTANNGFYWWELDITYYVIKLMSWLGLVWDLRLPPVRVLEEGRRALGATIPPEEVTAAMLAAAASRKLAAVTPHILPDMAEVAREAATAVQDAAREASQSAADMLQQLTQDAQPAVADVEQSL